MKIFKRNYIALFFLALIFAMPGLAAYIFYTHPQWLGSSTTNKGVLLNPPELISAINSKPKWRLILWNPDACEQSCLQQIDKLGRLRLALGRRLYDVEQWLISKNDQQLSPELVNVTSDQDVHVLLLSSQLQAKLSALTDKPQVFIANPDNYLVLAYGLDAKSGDIFHDLKQLLSSNDKKS